MIDREVWRMAWALLDAREKRNAFIVLGVVVFSALSSAVMVGSIMPFLSVLADPNRIESTPILAWTYDRFGFSTHYGFLVGLGITSIVIILAVSLVQIARVYVVARFALMRVYSISQRLMAAYLRQPYEFFLDRHSGDMSTRILTETQYVVDQFFRPAAELVAATLTMIAIVTLLVWVDPIVTFFAFVVLGGLYGAIYAFSRTLLKRLGKTRAVSNSARYRIVTEALGGIKDIKLLGREESYVDRHGEQSQRMARTLVSVQVMLNVPPFALQAIAFGGVILLCLMLIDSASLESGSALGGILPLLGVFAFAGQRLLPELSKLYGSLGLLQAGGAAVSAIYDDLVRSAGSVMPRGMPNALGLKRCLQLADISYRYPNAERPGIEKMSMTIHAREKIGIVGSTGAGKTTLADIILGLLRPSEGRMCVDDIEIAPDMVRSWQQSVGYVPQDIFLTDASVAENIALGVPLKEIDCDRVVRASKIAQLDRFIREELPEGYNTTVGERGVRLSGGQRQRIGIARALYHDADLIVFDEATSALDNLTEAEVMAAIDSLPGDKTVVMIAHRLSTVKRCDRIVVLDRGRVVGCDDWAALMAQNPFFQCLAQIGEVG